MDSVDLIDEWMGGRYDGTVLALFKGKHRLSPRRRLYEPEAGLNSGQSDRGRNSADEWFAPVRLVLRQVSV